MSTNTPEAQAYHRVLQELHLAAGRPSQRAIGNALGMSHSWASSAIRGPGLAPWDSVEALVGYLGGDAEKVAEIKQLWDAACLARTARPPRPHPRPAVEPAPAPPAPAVPAVPAVPVPAPLPADVVARIERVLADTDTCLVAIEEGREPPPDVIDRLPEWRKKLLLSIAEQTGILLPEEPVDLGDVDVDADISSDGARTVHE